MDRVKAPDFALVMALALFAFGSTFLVRSRDFSALPSLQDPSWRSLNTHSMVAARNWWEHGIGNTKASLYIIPISIENRGVEEKKYLEGRYSSYLPTFLLPAHAYQLARGRPIDLKELGVMGLVAHFLTILGFAALAYFLFLPLGKIPALGFAGASAMLSAWNVPALQYFGNAWWPDLVVIPLLAWFYASLTAVWRNQDSKVRLFFLGLIVFLGTATDWSFFLHVVILVPLFWATGKWRMAQISLVIPTALATLFIAYFFFLTADLASLSEVIRKRTDWGGFAPSALVAIRRLISVLPFTGASFFYLGFWALALVSALLFLWRGRRGTLEIETIVLLGVSFAPLFHFLIFRQHYQDHFYGWTKLVIPQACAAFFFLLVFRPSSAALWANGMALAHGVLVFALYSKLEVPFEAAGSNVESLARFVDEHTGIDDTLIATGWEFDRGVGKKPTPDSVRFGRAFVLSFKLSSHVSHFEEIPDLLDHLFQDRPELRKRISLKLLVGPKELPRWLPRLKEFAFQEHGGYRLYSLPPL